MAGSRPRVGIASTGLHIPGSFMTSHDVARPSGLPVGVVEEKLGLRRKPVPGPDGHTARMGTLAAQDALVRAGIRRAVAEGARRQPDGRVQLHSRRGAIMIAQGSGKVINTSSVVGVYGNTGQTNYIATKCAVIGMTSGHGQIRPDFDTGLQGLTFAQLNGAYVRWI